ncbi:hypothetical protein FIM12_06205 [SAR202 cluster bacterium AD-804-J14_MRT_500m]|nr:hypothetical protein [SAR202 cluster bacterium AD-804-J14_MRT_500m]
MKTIFSTIDPVGDTNVLSVFYYFCRSF